MIRRLDIDYSRSQFPGLGQDWTFFNNAAGTQMLSGVSERINEHLLFRKSAAGSPDASDSLQEGRAAMMQLLNARRPEDILLASSAAAAFQSLAQAFVKILVPGDEIIVSAFDHDSSITPWLEQERLGIKVRIWEPSPDTLKLELAELDILMTPRVRLVVVTQASNILGQVIPVAEIADFVHARGALIGVDAVAAAPHRAIDVQALDVDFLVISLYKLFGPHCAVVYGRYELLAKLGSLPGPLWEGSRLADRVQADNALNERAYGATAIVDYLAEVGARADMTDGMEVSLRQRIEVAYDAIARYESLLGEHFLSLLRELRQCQIVGSTDGKAPGRITTISFKGKGRNSEDVVRALGEYRLAVGFGDFRSRRLIDHLGLAASGGVVRVSMVHYNTLAEVDALTEALQRVLR